MPKYSLNDGYPGFIEAANCTMPFWKDGNFYEAAKCEIYGSANKRANRFFPSVGTESYSKPTIDLLLDIYYQGAKQGKIPELSPQTQEKIIPYMVAASKQTQNMVRVFLYELQQGADKRTIHPSIISPKSVPAESDGARDFENSGKKEVAEQVNDVLQTVVILLLVGTGSYVAFKYFDK